MSNFRKAPKNPNPFLPAVQSTQKNQHGFTSEARVVKGLGGRVIRGSGNKDHAKSDGLLETKMVGKAIAFRIECKSTKNDSLSLKYDWLLKILKEAFGSDRQPLLTVSFVKEDGTARMSGDWVMMPKAVFEDLMNGD